MRRIDASPPSNVWLEFRRHFVELNFQLLEERDAYIGEIFLVGSLRV